jgi:hypothetical protein
MEWQLVVEQIALKALVEMDLRLLSVERIVARVQSFLQVMHISLRM